MLAQQVAIIAAQIYGVETLSLQVQGRAQEVSPEAFVPAAVRLLKEAQRAEGLGWDAYLAETGQGSDGAPLALVPEADPDARGVVGEVGEVGEVGDQGSNASEA